ncbi:MAG: hypothetical protein R3C68_18065 [Myxococcota bacterium]
MQTRFGLLESIEQAYVSAIQTGQGKPAIAALHELSRAYENFAAFFSGLPIPGGLSGAEKSQYQAALQQQADTYKAKAEETKGACRTQARQLKILSEFGKSCVEGAFKRWPPWLTAVSVVPVRRVPKSCKKYVINW